MSSNPVDEVIHIIFSREDVEDIAADNDIDFDVAMGRAIEWASNISDTACSLIHEQLQNVIVSNQP